MARTSSYSDDLRDRLLAQAYERLQHGSPDAMSLRELAGSVGTSTSAVYAMFGGKAPLIDEVILRARRDLFARQVSIADQEPTHETLVHSGTEYRAWAREHPSLYRLMFERTTDEGGAVSLDAGDLAPLHTILSRLVAAGIVRAADPADLTVSMWASVHGFVLLELSLWPDGSPEADRLFASHLETLAQGVLTPAFLGAMLENTA